MTKSANRLWPEDVVDLTLDDDDASSGDSQVEEPSTSEPDVPRRVFNSSDDRESRFFVYDSDSDDDERGAPIPVDSVSKAVELLKKLSITEGEVRTQLSANSPLLRFLQQILTQDEKGEELTSYKPVYTSNCDFFDPGTIAKYLLTDYVRNSPASIRIALAIKFVLIVHIMRMYAIAFMTEQDCKDYFSSGHKLDIIGFCQSGKTAASSVKGLIEHVCRGSYPVYFTIESSTGYNHMQSFLQDCNVRFKSFEKLFEDKYPALYLDQKAKISSNKEATIFFFIRFIRLNQDDHWRKKNDGNCTDVSEKNIHVTPFNVRIFSSPNIESMERGMKASQRYHILLDESQCMVATNKRAQSFQDLIGRNDRMKSYTLITATPEPQRILAVLKDANTNQRGHQAFLKPRPGYYIELYGRPEDELREFAKLQIYPVNLNFLDMAGSHIEKLDSEWKKVWAKAAEDFMINRSQELHGEELYYPQFLGVRGLIRTTKKSFEPDYQALPPEIICATCAPAIRTSCALFINRAIGQSKSGGRSVNLTHCRLLATRVYFQEVFNNMMITYLKGKGDKVAEIPRAFVAGVANYGSFRTTGSRDFEYRPGIFLGMQAARTLFHFQNGAVVMKPRCREHFRDSVKHFYSDNSEDANHKNVIHKDALSTLKEKAFAGGGYKEGYACIWGISEYETGDNPYREINSQEDFETTKTFFIGYLVRRPKEENGRTRKRKNADRTPTGLFADAKSRLSFVELLYMVSKRSKLRYDTEIGLCPDSVPPQKHIAVKRTAMADFLIKNPLQISISGEALFKYSVNVESKSRFIQLTDLYHGHQNTTIDGLHQQLGRINHGLPGAFALASFGETTYPNTTCLKRFAPGLHTFEVIANQLKAENASGYDKVEDIKLHVTKRAKHISPSKKQKLCQSRDVHNYTKDIFYENSDGSNTLNHKPVRRVAKDCWVCMHNVHHYLGCFESLPDSVSTVACDAFVTADKVHNSRGASSQSKRSTFPKEDSLQTLFDRREDLAEFLDYIVKTPARNMDLSSPDGVIHYLQDKRKIKRSAEQFIDDNSIDCTYEQLIGAVDLLCKYHALNVLE